MSKKQVLIIINGAPGVGKTTLLRKLVKDLGLPGIGKDDIKELLFEHLGSKDREWSKDVGAVTFDMVYSLMNRWIGQGHSLIMECPFFREFAVDQIAGMVAGRDMTVIELYCKADPAVRRERFIKRVEDGSRHPGHADGAVVDTPEEEISARYAPLEVGDLIEIDTTNFGDADYTELLGRVRKLL